MPSGIFLAQLPLLVACLGPSHESGSVFLWASRFLWSMTRWVHQCPCLCCARSWWSAAGSNNVLSSDTGVASRSRAYGSPHRPPWPAWRSGRPDGCRYAAALLTDPINQHGWSATGWNGSRPTSSLLRSKRRLNRSLSPCANTFTTYSTTNMLCRMTDFSIGQQENKKEEQRIRSNWDWEK